MLRRAFLSLLPLSLLSTTVLASERVIRAEDLLHPEQYKVFLDGVQVFGCRAALPGQKGWVECYDLNNSGITQCPINVKRTHGHVRVERVVSV